ncbi:MAG TPA: 30S ribosomal protein S1 [Chthonomonadales bacterium]|nr:30S ribosomal protein S1 [Chthonomonadales bacterium]
MTDEVMSGTGETAEGASPAEAEGVQEADAVDAAEASQPDATAPETGAPTPAPDAPDVGVTDDSVTPSVEAPRQESFEDALHSHAEAYERSFPTFREGDVVKGTVVRIDREGVLVDVGAKSEGIIRPNELTREANVAAEDVVSVGEVIAVYVMQTYNDEGHLILSKKRADFEKAWDRVLEARDQGKTIKAMVTDRVKGGLVVDLGIRGFVPASHVGNGSLKINLDKFVGESIPLKVLEVDRDRHKVILSNKLAAEEERESKRATTVASLQVGQTRRGIVRRLTNYGAFVDLGGIDGLLHISEMSWTRINHPQEVLREGQEIDVLILKMDLNAGRVSLGLRQILPDPWREVEHRYSPGDVITGTVTRIVPFGVFVQVEGGVEGIVPNSELSVRRNVKAADVVKQGEQVQVKVVDVRPDERKMTLSLRQLQAEEEHRRERRHVEDFQSRVERDEPRFTIGDAWRARERPGRDDDEEE